jgi:hypothetical protein
MSDRTALSHWFPVVYGAGLPVPNTIIIDMPKEAQEAAFACFDGQEAGDMSGFIASIDEAARELGYPAFLRTDHTSGKHDWKDNCHLPSAEAIGARVMGIIEYSEIASFIGLPWDRWAVREMLPTKAVGICPRFGDMPICREFRFFVRGGEVVCKHPYWPLAALEQGGAIYPGDFDYDAFCRLSSDEDAELSRIASIAGEVLGGAWSVDLLETERGWFLTDMAEAHKSFHWDGCSHDFKAAFAKEGETQP